MGSQTDDIDKAALLMAAGDMGHVRAKTLAASKLKGLLRAVGEPLGQRGHGEPGASGHAEDIGSRDHGGTGTGGQAEDVGSRDQGGAAANDDDVYGGLEDGFSNGS